jgi:pyruvate/2-oxoglutarate/acetoin dehydrogenase E1 component
MSDDGVESLNYAWAINHALAEEMRRDERVWMMGQDVGRMGGVFGVTRGLYDEFGAARVRDTTINETFIVGGAAGAAMTGTIPVVELQFADFMLITGDEVFNKLAKWRYVHGGAYTLPVTLRLPTGVLGGAGAEHSQSLEAMAMHVPGLKVVLPATPADAKGLLKTAIRDPNPVIFIEHETLYGARGEVPENGDDGLLRFGEAAIRREGGDVTIVGILRMVEAAEKAAKTLAGEHQIEAEVIDPRTLRPLDLDTILGSIRKTNRAVIVEEGWPHGGVGANLAALIQEQAFDYLDAPVQRVTGADVPMPYSRRMEQAAIPHAEHAVSAALATLEGAS